MPDDRSDILKPELQVAAEEVRWHFIVDYYDYPISGLAWFRSRVFRFCCFPEDIPHQAIYVLHELTPDELTDRRTQCIVPC